MGKKKKKSGHKARFKKKCCEKPLTQDVQALPQALGRAQPAASRCRVPAHRSIVPSNARCRLRRRPPRRPARSAEPRLRDGPRSTRLRGDPFLAEPEEVAARVIDGPRGGLRGPPRDELRRPAAAPAWRRGSSSPASRSAGWRPVLALGPSCGRGPGRSSARSFERWAVAGCGTRWTTRTPRPPIPTGLRDDEGEDDDEGSGRRGRLQVRGEDRPPRRLSRSERRAPEPAWAPARCCTLAAMSTNRVAVVEGRRLPRGCGGRRQGALAPDAPLRVGTTLTALEWRCSSSRTRSSRGAST